MGSKQSYHFVHKKSPHLRTRRDVPLLKSVTSNEKSVKRIVQLTGYKRIKRGYKTLENLQAQFPDYKPPNDPYFKYQWYLVSLIFKL